ncbi:hypothetical protein HXX25_09040 [Hyphobacterium sp. CCMP332]|uniref:hypothetical protein n=1 Tax=Hyphobacterium sp. CCMP332 TaxID=2749086 RepID=UPI001650A6CE|nr:hypothetical protein [Hyphobacterium sp. CCMP332]QNL19443.1 hypothetical protein HXX25_09040 [Hyphobacterium sp. CCMP332]
MRLVDIDQIEAGRFFPRTRGKSGRRADKPAGALTRPDGAGKMLVQMSGQNEVSRVGNLLRKPRRAPCAGPAPVFQWREDGMVGRQDTRGARACASASRGAFRCRAETTPKDQSHRNCTPRAELKLSIWT